MAEDAQQNLWWANDDSDDESEHEDPNLLYQPGGGYQLATPIIVGNLAIYTDHDFALHTEELREIYIDAYGDTPYTEMAWQDFLRDLMPDSDPDFKDAAARDFTRELMFRQTQAPAGGIQIPDIGALALNDMPMGMVDEFRAAIEEFDLDFGARRMPTEEVIIPDDDQEAGRVILRTGVTPPFAPVIMRQDPPTCLVLCKRRAKSMPIKLDQMRCPYEDILEERLGPVRKRSLEIGDMDSTIPTDYSHTRPRASVVCLQYAGGDRVNIGSHGYELDDDVLLPLDFDVPHACDEFFSAPGGEGLSSPSPSHILHQMVSAIYSHAIHRSGHSAECEIEHCDFHVDRTWRFDVTTSAGIWNKSIRRTRDQDAMAAVSKYDMATALLGFSDDDHRNLVSMAIANCLACEYPSVYGRPHDTKPPDLALQEQIANRIYSLSKNTLQTLTGMCREAVIQEGLADLRQSDLYAQGRPYRSKCQTILDKLDSLWNNKKVAIPPYPIGEITALPADPWSFSICGHSFQVPGTSLGVDGECYTYSMDDCNAFLKHYPVDGRVSDADARELARLLNTGFITVEGLSHAGPQISDMCGQNEIELWRQSAEIYKRCPYAQLAEIKSDIVRAIHALAMPSVGKWKQVVVYKSKVVVWYRLRDASTSPDGYRIDWFAASSFKTVNSREMVSNEGTVFHLWPRQRLRSQEMAHAHMVPRRLKLTLAGMLEKMIATSAEIGDIITAWTRIAITATSTTWADGVNFIACKYLSASLSSPASPFDKLAAKIVQPTNFGGYLLIDRVRQVIDEWQTREQYLHRCALLGLPRAYSQLEAYWLVWVPDEFADTEKHFADCVVALFDEHDEIVRTASDRCRDLTAQLALLHADSLTVADLRASVRASHELLEGKKFGWSWVGSLASAGGLASRADPSHFDAKFCRGTKSRTISAHLTVRHSAYVDGFGNMKRGTVAECILKDGLDRYLSTVLPTFKFIYGRDPFYMNHPKKHEHKDREISVAEPKARMALNDAEFICGQYGRETGVDMLKRPDKNQAWYRVSTQALDNGGSIKSSDASRYAAMMSNYAISIMLYGLSCTPSSMHLQWAAVIYGRLAHRKMLIPRKLAQVMERRMHTHIHQYHYYLRIKRWIESMEIMCRSDGEPIGGYTDASHMGQGMSHIGSCLLGTGALINAMDAVRRCEFRIRGFTQHLMIDGFITSDDSAVVMRIDATKSEPTRRRERQRLTHLAMNCYDKVRTICLQSVSIILNEAKDEPSSTRGGFNTMDNGIGRSAPILGFREMICLLTAPQSPSLVGDYLSAYANARTVAIQGQGFIVGNLFQQMAIDSIEERWRLTTSERARLVSSPLLPRSMILGANSHELLCHPGHWLDPSVRGGLYQISLQHNTETTELDPHCQESIFGPLVHISVPMKRMHRQCIKVIKHRISELESQNSLNAARILDGALRSTLASGKSRGAGRVAHRVRNRPVKPRNYLEYEFEKAPMLESTLTWISQLESIVANKPRDARLEQLSLMLCPEVSVRHVMRYGYPRPITIRRFTGPKMKKPNFICGQYGFTPFGKHAIARSRATVVGSMTSEHRGQMQEYLSFINNRRFIEHVMYGGALTVSWWSRLCGMVTVRDYQDIDGRHLLEHVQWGNIRGPGLEYLKELQEQSEQPVLALQTYVGNNGIWHAVVDGEPLSVVYNCDITEYQEYDAIPYTLVDGRQVLLAIHGLVSEKPWSSTAPSKQEITDFQNLPPDDYPCPFVDQVMREIERMSGVVAPTYATEVRHRGDNVLVYVEPDIRTRPRDGPRGYDAAYLPYARGKCLSIASMAGYWYSSLKGVCLRAFMRGQYHNNTIWTSDVLGWRISDTSVPVYDTGQHNAMNVNRIFVIDGVDVDNVLSRFTSNPLVADSVLITRSDTKLYREAIQLPSACAQLISDANGGQRFHVGGEPPAFIDFRLPESRFAVVNDPVIARGRLLDAIERQDADAF